MFYWRGGDDKSKNLNCPMLFRRFHFMATLSFLTTCFVLFLPIFFPSHRCHCLLICRSVSSWCPAGCMDSIPTHIGSFEKEERNFKIWCIFLLLSSFPLNFALLYSYILNISMDNSNKLFPLFSEKCECETQVYF